MFFLFPFRELTRTVLYWIYDGRNSVRCADASEGPTNVFVEWIDTQDGHPSCDI